MALKNKKLDIKKILIYCSGFIWVALMEYWWRSDFRPYFGGILFDGPPGLTEAVVDFIEVGLLAVLTLFIGPKRTKARKISEFIMYFAMCDFHSFMNYPAIRGGISVIALCIQYFLGRKAGASLQANDSVEPYEEDSIWLRPPYLVVTAFLGVITLTTFLSGNPFIMGGPLHYASPFFGCIASVSLFEMGRKRGSSQVVGWKLMAIFLAACALLVVSLYMQIAILVDPMRVLN